MPLLFNESKKELRKELKPATLTEQAYHTIVSIRQAIMESVALPENTVYPIRVRYIRDIPYPSYRATVICYSKEKRSVKTKDGSKALVFAGKYVYSSYWVELQDDKLVFTPPLPKIK